MTATAAVEVRPPASVEVDAHPLTAGELLDGDAYALVRRRMLLESCKWDPQVGDVATLARFPLFIRLRDWRQLCGSAEALSAELFAAERELLDRPKLWRTLAIPRRLRRVLAFGAAGSSCTV